MSGTLPLVSCLCLTYARPEVLREAIWCFLQQDYPHKELIVVNDHPNPISLDQEYPGVRVVNVPQRFASMGEKRNFSVSLAKGEVLCVWDDDDLYLPWRLSQTVQHLLADESKWAYKPTQAWMSQDNRGYQVASNRFHSQLGIWRSAFHALGGYPLMNVGQDAAFEVLVPEDRWIRHQAAPSDLIYVYRWGNRVNHISGLGRDRPGQPTSWERMEQLNRGKPGGVVVPGFARDYWRDLLEQVSRGSRLKADEVRRLAERLAPFQTTLPGESDITQRIQRIQSLTAGIQGWLHPSEGIRLYQLARLYAPVPTVVELGSWRGLSTAWLAFAVKDRGEGQVYAVDHWKGTPSSKAHQQILKAHAEEQLFDEFWSNVGRLGLQEYVSPIKSDTAAAAAQWPASREIGLLFIDASHDYEDARRDFERWSPFVKSGGLVLFHDVPSWPGPTRVVSELPGWIQPVGAVKNLWAGRKV